MFLSAIYNCKLIIQRTHSEGFKYFDVSKSKIDKNATCLFVNLNWNVHILKSKKIISCIKWPAIFWAEQIRTLLQKFEDFSKISNCEWRAWPQHAQPQLRSIAPANICYYYVITIGFVNTLKVEVYATLWSILATSPLS